MLKLTRMTTNRNSFYVRSKISAKMSIDYAPSRDSFPISSII